MGIFKDVLDASASMHLSRAAMLGLVASDTVAMGALSIHICWPDLYTTLEFSKLVLLALAITAPALTLGTVTFHIIISSRIYSGLDQGLKESLTFATAMHLTASMLFLAGIGICDWISPTPAALITRFYWGGQGWFVFVMLSVALRRLGRTKTADLLGYTPPAILLVIGLWKPVSRLVSTLLVE